MANVELANDFHGTTCTIRCEVLSHIYHTATIRPNLAQIKRAKKALCGIAGCTCSGDAGTRGPQSYNGKQLEVCLDAVYATR